MISYEYYFILFFFFFCKGGRGETTQARGYINKANGSARHVVGSENVKDVVGVGFPCGYSTHLVL